MVERKLMIKYITEVWSDGTIETKVLSTSEEFETAQDKVTENSRYINLDSMSQRIAQVLTVIMYTYRYNGETGLVYIEKSLNRALADTSTAFGVTASSVSDKCTRQLKDVFDNILKMSAFKDMVKNYLINGNDKELKNLLIANAADKKGNDKKAIELFFKNPETPFMLNEKPL